MLLMGALAFLPLGIVGPGGMMIRYANVPYVYLVSGVLLILFSTMGESWAAFGLYSVAVLHLLLGGLGYSTIDMSGTATLFGVLRLTRADMVLHAVIAVGLAICGKMNTAKQQLIWD